MPAFGPAFWATSVILVTVGTLVPKQNDFIGSGWLPSSISSSVSYINPAQIFQTKAVKKIMPDMDICAIQECCHKNDGTGYVNYEKGCDLLLDKLQNKVFGQPLIVNPIHKSIRAHLLNESPPRPLIMYFSGWTGTGKTHVARLIAESLYKYGMKSKFVNYISSSYHFPTKIQGDHEIATHRQRLRDMIRDTVSKCERSLIILDELDKLPPGIVDILQPMLDYIEDVDGVRYNKAIFIFLSNTGSDKLKELAYRMYRDGNERKDLSSKDIEKLLSEESYREQGGLRGSSLLRRYSIGVFVPFLPLERQHIESCIKEELKIQQDSGYRSELEENLELVIESIADEMAFFPADTGLYSQSGCKGVHEKVINYLGPQATSRSNVIPPERQIKEEL